MLMIIVRVLRAIQDIYIYVVSVRLFHKYAELFQIYIDDGMYR